MYTGRQTIKARYCASKSITIGRQRYCRIAMVVVPDSIGGLWILELAGAIE